jgi:hypothetical protein
MRIDMGKSPHPLNMGEADLATTWH